MNTLLKVGTFRNDAGSVNNLKEKSRRREGAGKKSKTMLVIQVTALS